ncbi:Uncharacterised protein [Providencia stuartii]|nr:Uncharacterised protein [Providencia stuartii]
MKYFALLTKLGENLLAQATALGTKLELTHMAVGDGGGSLPTPDTNQTKLIAEKRRAAINTLFIDDKNKNQIIAEQIIPEQDGGWWIREIGLFDKTGNLIAVANCPETYKPQLVEGSGRTQSIRMVLIVSHTESVTLKIDPSVVLATREYVDDALTALDQKILLEFKRYLKIGDYGIGGEFPPEVVNADAVKLGGIYSPAGVNGINFYDPYAPMFVMNRNGVYIRQFQINGSGKIAARDIKGIWKIYSDDRELNTRYLQIGNPATSAKKLTNPSRIAGHIFYGEGEDIKISPQDVGAQPAGDYLKVGEYGIGGELPPQVTDANDAKKGGIYSPAGANGINFYDPYAPMFVMNRNGMYIRQFQITATGKIAARDIKGEWKVYSDDEELKKLFQPTGNYADGNLYRIGDSKNESWVYTPDKSKVFNINNTGLSGVYNWKTNSYLWSFNNEGSLTVGLIPVSCGGTGAKNSTDARKNLNALGVGDFGIGSAYPPNVSDANTLSVCGIFAGNGASGKNFLNPYLPILVMNRENNYSTQMQINTDGRIGTRFRDGVWQTYPTINEFNAKKSLGESQKWTNVKGSRSSGVSYTNTTGRTIALSVSTAGAIASSSVQIFVDDVLCSSNEVGGGEGTQFTRHTIGYAIIPPGSSYKVVASSIGLWAELR